MSPGSEPAWGPLPGWKWFAISVACAGSAALSLLGPWSISVDAWHWLRWGSELINLRLDTTGSWTTWKPLPSFLAAIFEATPFGAPALWAVTARASILVAAFAAFRVAAGLTSAAVPAPTGRGDRVAPWLAGLLAAILATRVTLGNGLMGSSEALACALVLIAIERALASRPSSALALGWAATLCRPEPAVALIAYTLWLRRKEGRFRIEAIVLPVIAGACWVVPDWIGSGNPGNASYLNRSYLLKVDAIEGSDGGATGSVRLLARALSPVSWVAVLIGLAAAGWRYREGDARPAAIVAAGALGASASVVLAGLGMPSLQRYTLPAVGALAPIAGFGAGFLVVRAANRRRGAGSRRLAVTALATIAASVLVVGSGVSTIAAADGALFRMERAAASSRQLDLAIAKAGGRDRIVRCLPIARKARLDGLIAWKLELPMSAFAARGAPSDPGLEIPFTHGTTFRDAPRALGAPIAITSNPIPRSARLIGHAGRWGVWQTCAAPAPGLSRVTD